MYTYEMYIKKENGLNPLNGSSGTVEIMTGATFVSDGKEGLVPPPLIVDYGKYLKGDGTWDDIDAIYARKNIYGSDSLNFGRKDGEKIGSRSFAFGLQVIASGSFSHAEGSSTTASGDNSHAEGYMAIASGDYSHAEGYETTASGMYTHASGYETKTTNPCSFVCGLRNVDLEISGPEGQAFVVGNGNPAKSNAFSVMFDGKVKAASTITASTTADYAEFFEWEDANPNIEDRVGKFVTLHGDKIDIAKSNEDYILGIVSGAPFVLGNGDCDTWTGMWLRDDFNRIIYEPAPKIEFDEKTGAMKEVFDEDGNLVYEGKRRKLNPDYDPSQKYISRFDRPEWAPVGMLGVLSVIQDGTCEVDGYCCCNEDGIATACDRNTIGAYRIIKKISDQVVRVVFR